MGITRRQFFGWMGAAIGSQVSLHKDANAASNKHFTGYPGSMGVLHDISQCIGCRKCETACNKVNSLLPPERPFDDLSVMDQKRRPHANTYTIVNRFDQPDRQLPVFVKKQCNHCKEPACVSACFVKALKKSKTGAVVYDDSLCVGCRYCMIACPFDIPAYEYDNPFTPEVTKCTLCQPRILNGQLPGCVEICPKEALTFGTRDELIQIARQRIKNYPDRYVNHIYGEHEMGGCNWLYISNTPFADLGMREDLGITPAPQLTSGALAAVPVVVSLWVVFITGIHAISKRKEQMAADEKQADVGRVLKSEQARLTETVAKLKEKAKEEKEAAVKREVKKALDEAAKQARKTVSDPKALKTPSETPHTENQESE
ncbi:MAG: 4Fe-4S dicluster domain-containing protein [Desulfobacteraceae bacterium]|nr:4Fe-4S dicluster domain-containing protein [Desulfobacteraceae bacterium]MBC2755285.1 4Fe-4S dicluster domain-containing protein [Desulfobacteraceae bacterium]